MNDPPSAEPEVPPTAEEPPRITLRRRRQSRPELVTFKPPAASYTLSDCEHGEAPGDGLVGLYLDEAVIKQILQHCAEHRDVEVGGYLFGQAYVDEANQRAAVRVSDCYPIQDEHATAVAFRIGVEHSAAAERHQQQHAPESQIVGWYHSHPGHGVFMSGTDQRTHLEHFAAFHRVAMVVDPVRGQFGAFVSDPQRQGVRPLRSVHVVQSPVAEPPHPSANPLEPSEPHRMSTATPPPAPSTPATEPNDHRAKRGVGNGAAPAWALALSTLLILLTVLVSAYQLGRNQRANAQDLRDEFRDDLSRVERELTKKVLDLNLDTLKTERAQADRLAQQGAALLELMEQSQGQANRLATWQNAWQRRWAAMQNQLEQIEQQQRAQAQRRQELLQLTQSLQEQQAAIQRALQERSQQTQQRLEGLNTRLERLDQTRQEAERRVQQRAERLAQHEADQAASLRALRAEAEQLRQAIADLGRRMGPATEADTSGQAAAEADPTPATQPASTTPPAESADAP